MPNTITLHDWLRVMDDEYLSGFVRDGGASIKFAVTPDEVKAGLYAEVERRCRKLGYLLVRLNAADMRAHMPQDIFFKLASQVDWRLLSRRMILRLAAERGYTVDGIGDDPADGVFDSVAEANGLDRQFVLNEIRPGLQNSIFKNLEMAKDFRVGMTQLCLEEGTRGDYNGQPLLDWLTGANTRISSVRPFSIYTGINRTTARYFIESALHWIRLVGYAGTVILLDSSRVTVARNPRDGRRYYTRPMAMEHYQLLREFIDSADRLSGMLLLVVTNYDFLDDGGGARSRGYRTYDALYTRIMDDVRDRNRVNPVASLVRLSEEETVPW